MPNEFRLLTRIRPLACGFHDPTKEYGINSLVTTTDGLMTYLSKQDVPAGVRLSDGEYWIIHTDLSHVAENLKVADADDIALYSNGHMRRIWYTLHASDYLYYEVNGEPVQGGAAPASFSDYIPCPKYLGMNFIKPADGKDPGCYLYFYKFVDGAYEIEWDTLRRVVGESKVMNYVSFKSSKGGVIKIPDGRYMRIARDRGSVELYGWDGEKFGQPLSADLTSYSENYALLLNADGGSGITVPGEAKAIVCREDCSLGAIRGITIITDDMPETEDMFDSSGKKKQFLTSVLTASPVRFFKLPGGYDYYRVHFNRKATAIEGNAEGKITYTGDVSDLVCAVCPSDESQRASARALQAIERGRKLNQVSWMPAADLKVHNSNRTFKSGVTYNGLPYGPGAYTAHFIGWHVSLHTFLNAINDPDSVMYKDANGEMPAAPFYSTVCSVFAAMVAGWPIPVSNVGLLYDPNVDYHVTDVPEIGAVWSNIYDLRVSDPPTHCVVPERIDWRGDKCSVSAYESVIPISERTTRYSELAKEKAPSGYQESSGLDYYDLYGVAAHYIGKPDEMGAPYLNFDDTEIINGSARPYKGDKSVYTSADEKVLINIKVAGAGTLYLTKDGNKVSTEVYNRDPAEFAFSDGTKQIDVKAVCEAWGTGIYHVYTDKNSVRESFEYVKAKWSTYKHVETDAAGNVTSETEKKYALTWKISDSSIVIKDLDNTVRGDFWYTQCGLLGHPYLFDEENGWDTLKGSDTPVLYAKNNKYGRWFEDGKRLTEVRAVFFKGQYGAYTLPIKAD